MNIAYVLVTPAGAVIGWAGLSGGAGVQSAAIAFASGNDPLHRPVRSAAGAAVPSA